MNNTENPSNSDVSINYVTSQNRNIILLIFANIYYWPKLMQYFAYYIENVKKTIHDASYYTELLTYSVGLPVYVACALLIFNIPFGPRWFWKVLVSMAILDELFYIYVNWDLMILDEMVMLFVMLFPLYFMGAIYAFMRKELWSHPKYNTMEGPIKNQQAAF